MHLSTSAGGSMLDYLVGFFLKEKIKYLDHP
jgi:hypothetical protein